ncbi:AraC family transcriptional regulator [Muricomes sp. OA1]|uniref:AraC family transcriptional regulator n=1 Tax=Hungatella hathewayi TaxID=154046 RepID=A0A3E2WW79_9FIRM|nr:MULTISPECIES: AraC family transcriptional regulator [Clostridia]MCH1975187.1 AraC family transcriptional regulator [Muricomes sp. OA1]RGC32096.1 AraC family transcriptional regulator [Hungatella hathewayi]GKH34019.1 AraC family transcriptional regulator [Faecalicatena contorta]
MRQNTKVLERGSHTWSEDSIRMILTPSSTARSTYFYTQEVGYFKTFHPYFSERENLDSFLIVYTVSGKGYLEYEGQTYPITKGQCFYINCEQHHLYRTGREEDWEILWIHFNGNSALGYYKEFTRNGFQILSVRDEFFMERTLWRIIALNQKKDLTTELVTSNLINGMLTELLLQTATNNADTFLIPDYIRQIVREIDKNFKSGLPLSYFEEFTHRSRYYILKEFKKYIGVTIHEYIITARISYAKELLKYSDLPVSEIAFEAGMNNVTHFINLFKAREGATPLAYRKAWRN